MSKKLSAQEFLSRELARLRDENAALRKEVEQLKRANKSLSDLAVQTMSEATR